MAVQWPTAVWVRGFNSMISKNDFCDHFAHDAIVKCQFTARAGEPKAALITYETEDGALRAIQMSGSHLQGWPQPLVIEYLPNHLLQYYVPPDGWTPRQLDSRRSRTISSTPARLTYQRTDSGRINVNALQKSRPTDVEDSVPPSAKVDDDSEETLKATQLTWVKRSTVHDRMRESGPSSDIVVPMSLIVVMAELGQRIVSNNRQLKESRAQMTAARTQSTIQSEQGVTVRSLSALLEQSQNRVQELENKLMEAEERHASALAHSLREKDELERDLLAAEEDGKRTRKWASETKEWAASRVRKAEEMEEIERNKRRRVDDESKAAWSRVDRESAGRRTAEDARTRVMERLLVTEERLRELVVVESLMEAYRTIDAFAIEAIKEELAARNGVTMVIDDSSNAEAV